MIARLVFFLLIAFPLVALPQEPTIGPKEGFRDLRWGENISAHPEMKLVPGKPSASKMYRRPSDKLSIGDAVLDSIYYVFCLDELCSVEIEFTGVSNYGELAGTMKARFGTPTQPNRYMSKFYWLADPIFTAILEFSAITKKGSITLADQGRYQKAMDADKARQAKGTKDM